MPCEVSDEFLQDPLMQVPMIDPPRGKMSEVVRNWVDGVSGWAIVNRTLISHVRVVESMGNAGRQLAALLRNVRKDAHHMFGQAQADLMNAFQKMKTGAQYQEFVRHLDEGTAVADVDVQLAVDAFRTHQKFLENGLVKQGTKVMMADGKSKLLGETLVPNFFPHQHDWDKIMKDEEMVQKMVDQLETAYPGLLPKDGIRDPRRFIEEYRKSASMQKMPKFSSLFERNVRLPGWMGDPNTLASVGDTAYKADVQHSVMGYLEDAYTMFSANKHLGAPKGYRFDDGDMMTNLEPINRALKKELDSADDVAQSEIQKFADIAAAQRDAPEEAMVKLASAGHSNLFGTLLEDGGDLIHRMAEQGARRDGGFAPMNEKVNSLLRKLQHEFPVDREINEQVESAVEYWKSQGRTDKFDTVAAAQADQDQLRAAYVQAHQALTPANEAQRMANQVAISLGNKDFKQAEQLLLTLKGKLDEGRQAWKTFAREGGEVAENPRAFSSSGAQDKATKFNIFGGTDDEIENIRSTLTGALTRLNRYFDTDIDTSRINIRLIDPEDFTPKAGLASEKNLSAHLQTMGDGRAQIRINKNFLSDDKFRTLEEDIVHEITHFMDDNNLIPSEFKERLGALNAEDLADKVGRGNVPRDLLRNAETPRAFSSPEAVERLAAQGNTNAQELIEKVAGQFKPRSFENSTGKWKADALLQAIAQEGFDANLAGDLVENVLGSKYYRGNERKLSSWLRNYNVVTKLGTLMIENIGQMTVTSTKVGLRTSLKALRDVVTDWQGSVEFARTAGALHEDAMRGLEADAGRNFAGMFLERSGFRFTEKLLRTHAAVSGKHYVRELLTRVGTNPMDAQALRQLRKLEFNTDDIVKNGQLTELGAQMTNSVGSDSKLEKVITRLAGFETSRQTQFLADVMEMPAAVASPIGKIAAQYKSFVFNSTKFMMRDVMDEAAHGTASMARSAAGLAKGDTALAARELSQAAREFAPIVRLVLTGIAMGEATQGARAIAQGEDPAQRGQAGWIRDLIGSDIPREDNAAIVFLGQRFVKNDVAARMIENMLSIGYGGVFSAMLQNAIVGGKMRTMAFIAGPSVDSALDIAAGVGKAFQGNPEALGRRVLREGGSVLGGLVPIKGVAFAGAALGKQAQIAALPTSSQMERSAYLTVDEQREQVMKRVEKRVRDTRQLVRNAVANGNIQEATQIINHWNAGASQELGMLREVGALGHGSFESITFDRDEISRMMEGEEAAPGAFEQATNRVQERF